MKNDIDAEIDRRIKKHGYGEHLYHYTTVTTLWNILKSKEFWLGSTSSMNDSKEIRYFIELLQKALLEDIPTEKEQCNKFFEKVFARINDEYSYAMCFSKLQDDAAQWERYADSAKGVCIILNTHNTMRAFWECGILFNEVYYDFDIRKHQHYALLSDYFVTGHLKGFDKEDGEVDNAIACGYVHKHPGFRSEQEIRIITLWDKLPNSARIETECVGDTIRKFMKFDMNQRCTDVDLSFQDLFDGIIIGPRSGQNVGDLLAFFEEQEITSLKGKICRSECPLR